MVKVIDCFIFYNELKMLQLRLEELYDTVDYFILVEATKTHKGDDKNLFFKDNMNLFQKYIDKIVYVLVDDMPCTDNPWDNEKYQRECINKGIQRLNLNDNDLLIITDCDEIPNYKKIQEIKNIKLDDIYILEMTLYMYNFTCKSKNLWRFAKILPYYIFKLNNFDCNKVRMASTYKVVKDAGWHLTYFGDNNFIKNKLKSYAHQELNTSTNLSDDRINFLRDNCKYFVSGENLYRVSDYNNLPKNYKLLLD